LVSPSAYLRRANGAALLIIVVAGAFIRSTAQGSFIAVTSVTVLTPAQTRTIGRFRSSV
jgi:hypothetical protein